MRVENVVNVSGLFQEENLKHVHTIPLGTLVEVTLDYSEQFGVRGFVVEHTRDCDGEPLYAISLMPLKDALSIRECFPDAYRFTISDGWTADCLNVIE